LAAIAEYLPVAVGVEQNDEPNEQGVQSDSEPERISDTSVDRLAVGVLLNDVAAMAGDSLSKTRSHAYPGINATAAASWSTVFRRSRWRQRSVRHDRPMYLELTHSNQAQVAAAIVRPVARGNSASPLYPGKYAVYGLGGNRTI
jgi:hypothetical protein